MSQGRKEEALHVFTVAAERFPGVPLVISPFHHHNQVNYQLCLSIPDSPSLSFSLFLSLSLSFSLLPFHFPTSDQTLVASANTLIPW